MAIARTFTLPEPIVAFLDSLPSKEKSKYVANALLKSIEEQVQQEALSALHAIKPIKDEDPRDASELVREAREKRLNSITNNN